MTVPVVLGVALVAWLVLAAAVAVLLGLGMRRARAEERRRTPPGAIPGPRTAGDGAVREGAPLG